MDPRTVRNDLPEKPPRMHWATYDRLVERYQGHSERWGLAIFRRLTDGTPVKRGSGLNCSVACETELIRLPIFRSFYAPGRAHRSQAETFHRAAISRSIPHILAG